MRILITGGAGFIGTHLTKALAAIPNNEIIVFDNLHRGSKENVAAVERVSFIEGDVRDYDALLHAMSGVEEVFHLAAQSNVLGAIADIDYSFTSNVAGTFNVLKASRAKDVKRVVFTSSREVYGEVQSLPVSENAPLAPKNAYGASKAAGEMYCRIFNSEAMKVVVLRLANVYGPGDRNRVIPLFFQNALSGEPLTIYGRNKLLDFIWIGDVVQALLSACVADAAGLAINVGTGKGTSLDELANAVRSLCATDVPVVHLEPRGVEVDRYVADTSLASSVLNCGVSQEPLSRLNEVWQYYKDLMPAGSRVSRSTL